MRRGAVLHGHRPGLAPRNSERPPEKEKARRGRLTDLDWTTWADAVAPRLSGEQRAGFWALCDRARPYEVVEVATKG